MMLSSRNKGLFILFLCHKLALISLHIHRVQITDLIIPFVCRHDFKLNRYCRIVKELLRVGLHWHVPFIEVLSETVQVVW